MALGELPWAIAVGDRFERNHRRVGSVRWSPENVASHAPPQRSPLSWTPLSVDAHLYLNGSKLNFWPATFTSAIKPPFVALKTATPFWNSAWADAPDLSATAPT